VSGFCLFLWIVGLLHLKMSATEQHANIICCVLLQKSPSEKLQMLEEAINKNAGLQVALLLSRWAQNRCFLHDNELAHWSLLVKKCLAKKIVATNLENLLYFPDLSLLDFLLFQ
jgi:hypothetical protein